MSGNRGTEVTELMNWRAACIQRPTHAVNSLSRDEARKAIFAAIEDIDRMIPMAIGWHGADTKLVQLPEFTLTGFNMGHDIEAWTDLAAIAPDGPEYEALSAIAQKYKIYLSGHAYESDPAFPGMYFAATWIIAPNGDNVYRYRRLHSGVTPSPYDVWDKYLDVYGLDAVFPVAHTELGRLASIPCGEIMYPEVSRVLALRGAEVLLHPTSEPGSLDPWKHALARRARAIENCMYVVSANSAGIFGAAIAPDMANGYSEALDYEGRVIARAEQGVSVMGGGEIDIAAVRRARQRPGLDNYLSQTKGSLWGEVYSQFDIARPNKLLGTDGKVDYGVFRRAQEEAMERMRAGGILPS